MPAAVLPPPPGDPFHPHDRETRRPRTRLADLLYAEMDRRGITSTAELGKEVGVAQGTAWRLLNEVSVPREDTLSKMARFLRLSIVDVRRAAGRAPGEPDPFVLPREFDQLTESQRDAIRRVGWEFLAAQGRRVTRGQ